MLHISLAAEKLWIVWGLPVTNALLTSWVVMALLGAFAYVATRKMSMRPSTIQLIAESIVGGLYDFFETISGKNIKQFFPIIASFFIFILIANWVGLLPGVGTVGYFRTPHEAAKTHAALPGEAGVAQENADSTGKSPEGAHTETAEAAVQSEAEFVPLLRGATADLNTTIALAIIAVVAMQYYGFRNLGTHYFGRFINFKDPIHFGVGILEFVSDISKVVSFAFRLFGNIFAGEVLLAVMAFLMPFIVPLPFLFMELFVGVVQALVFSMLTAAFFNVAVTHE